jgi:hypothetical protein
LEVASDISKTANFDHGSRNLRPERQARFIGGNAYPGIAGESKTHVNSTWLEQREANLGDFQNPNDHTIEATFTGCYRGEANDEWLNRYHTKGFVARAVLADISLVYLE